MISHTDLSSVLESEAFASMDRHFADFMERLAGGDDPALALASALASRWLSDGQTCLPLEQVAGRPFPQTGSDGIPRVQCPTLDEWTGLLRKTPVVGKPGESRPLILDDAGRLFLQRYWQHERTVASDLLNRLRQPPASLDDAALAGSFLRLFPASTPGETNWQQVAVFAAMRQGVSVITGGPGTGKTYTVARLLAALFEQPGGAQRIVRLAAPTGKAVARLQESLSEAAGSLQARDDIKARLQDKNLACTLHRLLGTMPDSPDFRHNAGNPLPVDVLIVDEASMIGLSLMARLLAALKPEARLVLVGDNDQLPPVDPGSVLHDLCQATAANRFSVDFREACRRCCGARLEDAPADSVALPDTVIRLAVNHRSGNSRFLHAASQSLNAGDADAFVNLARDPAATDSTVVWKELPRPDALKNTLREMVRRHYAPVLQCASVAEALELFGRFRILCAVREGPYGCESINRLVETILQEEQLIPSGHFHLSGYRGKPVMVTANNYVLKLFNGDIGLAWPEDGRAMVHFPSGDNGATSVALERLPAHETVYAMTVHKSQGSEFQHVLVILPDRESPLLTRQLLYTGLTRARQSVSLLSPERVLRQAIHARAQRASGLGSALNPAV
jgi:exodeoxyribonuclease V alpha subunit